MKPLDVESRFQARQRASGDCILWTGTILPIGYGQMSVNGKLTYAHRLAYQLRVGPIPPGMHVLHTCDVRACVNPKHLWLGTNRENIADRVAKGRSNPDRSKVSGERSNLAKLTAADVARIRAMRREGMTLEAIASNFPITFNAVHAIVSRRNWKHVP